MKTHVYTVESIRSLVKSVKANILTVLNGDKFLVKKISTFEPVTQ